MNNPIAQIVSMAQRGGNPMQMMQNMAMQDPRARMAMQMVNGKSPEQIKQICTNMCRERGTTPEQVARSLGLM